MATFSVDLDERSVGAGGALSGKVRIESDKALDLKGIRLELKCFYKRAPLRHPDLQPLVLPVPKHLSPGSQTFEFEYPISKRVPASLGSAGDPKRVEFRLYVTALSQGFFTKDLFACTTVFVHKALATPRRARCVPASPATSLLSPLALC